MTSPVAVVAGFCALEAVLPRMPLEASTAFIIIEAGRTISTGLSFPQPISYDFPMAKNSFAFNQFISSTNIFVGFEV
jgi:hypothetical protein